jgi:hypothetical protein
MKDTRFGENNNVERLQLLFSQLVMGMPDDQQVTDNFGRWVERKGEEWAQAQLGIVRDGYPTVLKDGEGNKYTITFDLYLCGDLTIHATSPREALKRFRAVEPRRLPIECCFDNCVTVDETGTECRVSELDEIELDEKDESHGREEGSPRTWIDPCKRYEPVVEQLSDDDLCNLVAVIHRRLCIPNWFTRAHLEGIAGQDVSADDWDGFLEWLDDTRIPDYMSEQLREWWGDYRRYKQNQEGDDR